MQVGDLVKRKPIWGEWVEYNPWMYTEKDFEVGMIINVEDRSSTTMFLVLIGGSKTWYSKKELDLINESRRYSKS